MTKLRTTILTMIILMLTVTTVPCVSSAAQTMGKPTGFSAAGYTYNSAKIKWKPVSNVTGYKLYRATKKNGKYSCIKKLAGSATSWTNKNLKPGRTYYYKMRAYKTEAKTTRYSAYTAVDSARGTVKKPGHFKATGTSVSDRARLSWGKVPGISYYRVYRASSKKGKYKAIKTVAKNKTVYYDNSRKKGATYYYKMRAVKKAGKRAYTSAWTAKDPACVKDKVMGSSHVTASQLEAYYKKYAKYPSYYATNKKDRSADTLHKFCEMYISECRAEGVRADVAFCQAMEETGWLKFKGDVEISQFNFAGLGATGGGRNGSSFSKVRTGIRAQVQHLKAYSSKSALKNKCVDPRFKYVKRASAVYVQWLGIKENPKGAGWAAKRDYGYRIMKLVQKI